MCWSGELLFTWSMGAIHEVVVDRILERLPYEDCT